jgi:hypothetical protein
MALPEFGTWTTLGAMALMVTAVVGCGRDQSAPLGAVNGRVISAASSRPLPNAQVLIEWHARVEPEVAP